MDASGATGKIANVVVKINEYVDKIIEIRNKYIIKINKLLDELEGTINNAIKVVKNGVDSALVWLDIKIKKITKSIQDMLNNLIQRIKAIVAQLAVWYDTTITRIKCQILTAAFAKIGQSQNEATINLLAALIPHP